MEYGEKITTLRKSKGMTQAELGEKLNVTFQAVSKWERGESYPDFETLSKIAKIFGVPISYFENGNFTEDTSTEDAANEALPAMLGICTVCGKVIYEGNEGQTSPSLVCTDCVRKQTEQKRQEYEQKLLKENEEKQEEKEKALKMRNKGLITAGVICGLLLILFIVNIINSNVNIIELVASGAVVILLLFTFISQLFWHGIVVDICLAGVKIIGTPGIIFTFDLDGFIFLIAMKILFALLKLFVLLLCMLTCAIAAILVSPFTFIPATIKLNRGILPD